MKELLAKIKESKRYLFLMALGILLLLLLAAVCGIVLASVLIVRYQQRNLPPTPISTPSGQVAPPPGPVSKFATDAAVLKKREELKGLLNEIDTTDYFEAQISPPSVNANIKIE